MADIVFDEISLSFADVFESLKLYRNDSTHRRSILTSIREAFHQNSMPELLDTLNMHRESTPLSTDSLHVYQHKNIIYRHFGLSPIRNFTYCTLNLSITVLEHFKIPLQKMTPVVQMLKERSCTWYQASAVRA